MPASRHTQLCTFALLLLVSTACTSTRRHEDLAILTTPGTHSSHSAPDWIGMEARGWQRLNAIEAWLETSAAHEPKWRNYARIQLAKGWLNQPSTDHRTHLYRTKRSEDILRLVINDPAASDSHRAGARRLLSRSLRLVHGPLPAKVRPRSAWNAKPSKDASMKLVGGPWERITIHHSDDVDGLVFDKTFSQSCYAVRSIQRHHQTGKDWGDIGYHFLVDGLGTIFEGRPLKWQGAHAGNDTKNRRNLGVCLLGNFEHEPPSRVAREALHALLENLREQHNLPRRKVYLHSDFTSTDCPGRHLSQWVRAYRIGTTL
jgi:hypothetical protein